MEENDAAGNGKSHAENEPKVRQEQPHSFEVGDAVYISSLGRTGIVYEKRIPKAWSASWCRSIKCDSTINA